MKPIDRSQSMKDNTNKDSKPSSAAGCNPNIHPQQQEFHFDDLTLDSCFDSGNMASAVKAGENQYHVWIASDCAGTPKENDYRTWFHFRVKELKKHTTCTFTVKNMNFQGKLFSEGLVPVFKTNSEPSKWKKIDEKSLDIQKQEKGLEVTFKHTFDQRDEEVYFAFTYPWSYSEDQDMLNHYEEQFRNDTEIYFNRELLTFSREKRRIEYLTITSHSKKLEQREQVLPNLFPQGNETTRPFMFQKKYVFITARVHPGETPASFVFNGLMKFLLNKEDPRAQALRDNFVMVLIPMLNPDGVYRGHYRSDTHGLNLNRYYINPSVTEHPSIYGAKSVMLQLNNSKRLYLYCDLHAHATKRGCFVYGNNLEFRQQVDTLLFPKLLSLNSQYFEYDSCNFDEKNVNVKDRGDKKNKEGAGRVALYKATNLVRCYTLECNYASGKYKNVLSHTPKMEGSAREHEEGKKILDGEALESLTNEKVSFVGGYASEDFEEIGEGLGPTLLDMINANPMSRIQSSVYKSVKNVKLSLATKLMKDPPFRFDVYLRKINRNVSRNIDTLVKYLDENIKTEPVDDQKRERGEREAKAFRIAKTVTPQERRRTLKESKENCEPKDMKEAKVVNLVVQVKTKEVTTTVVKLPKIQAKSIVRKGVVPLGMRFGIRMSK